MLRRVVVEPKVELRCARVRVAARDIGGFVRTSDRIERRLGRKDDVEGCKLIRPRIKLPLIADIHYDYRMALACLDATTADGRPAVDKIRIDLEMEGPIREREAVPA